MAPVSGNSMSTRAALYLRLSRDDAGAGESVSIGGQRAMLRAFAADHGWTVVGEYVDDGYSGTSFRRPGLQRLLEDVETGQVDLVLTKDLSRLGRDYIRTGELAEVYFPSRHVRYIAVNDGFDTQGPDNGMAPFQHVVNEMYARDASKKIRSALATRRAQGRYVGSLAPYGYKKDPADRNRLLPDPPAAEVVTEIFDWAASGIGPGEIACRLNGQGVACPRLHRSGGRPGAGSPAWTASTVSKLLKNPTYLGCTAQGRTRKPSLKAKIREAIPQKDWTVVEGTHPALVKPEVFALVAKHRRHAGKGSFQNRLAGLIRCGNCGGDMVSAGTRRKDSPAVLVCSSYKRKGPGACGRHAVHYPVLLDLLGQELQQALALTEEERSDILDVLIRRACPYDGGEDRRRALSEELRRLERLEGELWDSRLLGELTEERFQALLNRSKALRMETAQKLRSLSGEEPLDSTGLRTALEQAMDQVLAHPEEDIVLLFSLVETVKVGERERDGTLPLTMELTIPAVARTEYLERVGPMSCSKWKVISLDNKLTAIF